MAGERDFPRSRPCHVQQVVDQSREVMGLAMDDLSKPRPPVLAAGPAVIERGHGVYDRSERVAQLVGQRGEEFIIATIGLGRIAIESCVLEEDNTAVADTLDLADLSR